MSALCADSSHRLDARGNFDFAAKISYPASMKVIRHSDANFPEKLREADRAVQPV